MVMLGSDGVKEWIREMAESESVDMLTHKSQVIVQCSLHVGRGFWQMDNEEKDFDEVLKCIRFYMTTLFL